ncbi:hypothetical protein UK23_05700 [Lentzea aerocolonigenes]|uniref:Gram-positive cocci surface proteins LPxTG domain-containing protein n=1 Tax=Lentzea aerocolonigenes TaxID=68170 RepID=A0A0F0HBT3_LENAE|nr:hypothetical protein [Lentzea aerocolonigenes]KJK51802.1 hypothetical protein UK23_05700 [Lentzea aerocolonigenes]
MKRLFFALALVIGFLPVPAQAAGCDGVTVVVDFRGLGGGVRQGCAPGSPASGVAALSAAGFGYTFASRQPGFVCRINEKPGTDTDKCVTTSPASAYWSYWHAPAGGAWSYSNSGAASHVPARGTAEGWAFGAGEQPGMAPPAAPAPQQPAPQPPQVPAPVNPPAGQPQPTTTTPPVPSSSSVTTSSEPSSTAVTTTTSGSEAVEIKAESAPPEEKASPGWWWTAIGVLLIAALVVAGLLVARRRRGGAENE